MADVAPRDVDKAHDNGFRAVTGLNLKIKEAEFLVTAGPSGCGKSTTLQMIASSRQLRLLGLRKHRAASPPRCR